MPYERRFASGGEGPTTKLTINRKPITLCRSPQAMSNANGCSSFYLRFATTMSPSLAISCELEFNDLQRLEPPYRAQALSPNNRNIATGKENNNLEERCFGSFVIVRQLRFYFSI